MFDVECGKMILCKRVKNQNRVLFKKKNKVRKFPFKHCFI